MKFSVCQFVGFGDGYHLVDAVSNFQVDALQLCLISHNADDGDFRPPGEMDIQSLAFDLLGYLFYIVVCGCGFHNYDHICTSLFCFLPVSAMGPIVEQKVGSVNDLLS